MDLCFFPTSSTPGLPTRRDVELLFDGFSFGFGKQKSSGDFDGLANREYLKRRNFCRAFLEFLDFFNIFCKKKQNNLKSEIK